MHFKLSFIFLLSIIETIFNEFSVTNVEGRRAFPIRPGGYTPFPQFGVAYKIYELPKSWADARIHCAAEFAVLGVIDSWAKVKEVNDLRVDREAWIHVGIYWSQPLGDWVKVNTQNPAASLPWAEGEPNGHGKCVGIDADEDEDHAEDEGLLDYDCLTQMGHFVCQIPLPM